MKAIGVDKNVLHNYPKLARGLPDIYINADGTTGNKVDVDFGCPQVR